MKHFIFLCGSSSVGKTTLMNAFPTSYEGHHIQKVEMNFRSIRAQLGNPSWEQLVADKAIGMHQQIEGMNIYQQRIMEKYAEPDQDVIYLFERCPFDIVGYSYAFNLPTEHIQHLVEQAGKMFEILNTSAKALAVHRFVDYRYAYDRQNDARPSDEIRHRCDSFLKKVHSLHSLLYNIHTRISVNQDEAEIRTILKEVIHGSSSTSSSI